MFPWLILPKMYDLKLTTKTSKLQHNYFYLYFHSTKHLKRNVVYMFKHLHTKTHTHIYIYIYIYIYISGDSSLFLKLVTPPPPSVNFSSQPVVRGPKVSHHSCYCVILRCIAQIDKRTLHGIFFVNNQDTI